MGLRDQFLPKYRVEQQDVSLSRQGSSVRGTLQKDAVRREGIDVDDPGEVTSYWIKGEGLLVFDLRGEEPEPDGDRRATAGGGRR